MITIEEIRTGKEGQTFDLKSIQIDPKALAIPIVAMANADGGMLAIGISDKTRKIEGVNQHTEKLNELLRVPFDFCNPSVPVTCRYMDCIDNDGNPNRILIMDIPASQFLHTNQADEAYVRVGDKSRKLTFDERMQLMYDKGERFYEDTAVYGATIDDIDMDAVAEYAKLVGYGKSPLEYLRENNGFVTTNKKGEEDVSVACILLFGKNPQKFFPRSRTRFIRYEGVDEKVGAEMNVPVVIIQNSSFKKWWLMHVAIEPTISKEQRYKSKCSMTVLCLNRQANYQVKSSQRISEPLTSLAIRR